MTPLALDILPGVFAVHRLAPGSALPAPLLDRPFVWIGRTEDELSIVCPEGLLAPEEVEACEAGWRALRIRGPLDLALVGVLHELAGLLAAAGLPIFALSTFATDTILVRADDLDRAVAALEDGGHDVRRLPVRPKE